MRSKKIKDNSPVQGLIDRMNERLGEKDVTTKKLAQIIEMAASGREGLLESDGIPENDWWAHQAIKDFTEVIVRANFIAQTKLNPNIAMPAVESQVKKALDQVARRIRKIKKERK